MKQHIVRQSTKAIIAATIAATLCMPCTFAMAAEPTSAVGASTLDALSAEYQAAVQAYEDTLNRQSENNARIEQTYADIEAAEVQYEQAKERLRAATVAQYKNAIEPGDLFTSLFSSDSLHETLTLIDDYEHIAKAREAQCADAEQECADLSGQLAALDAERQALEAEVAATREQVEAAKDALRKASHLDGDKYHQLQMNGVNCGATAFIVGVNIMLNKNVFKDNEKVWSSDAFGSDSTVNLDGKGQAWLEDNGLDGVLSFDSVPGDITETSELRELLEDGNIVVISSGSGSEWIRVDQAEPQKGLYPDGHWIVFYGYSEGIYYANDSAVPAKKGAGCPYTEEQMQQWLDGRGNHFACVLTCTGEIDLEELLADNEDVDLDALDDEETEDDEESADDE